MDLEQRLSDASAELRKKTQELKKVQRACETAERRTREAQELFENSQAEIRSLAQDLSTLEESKILCEHLQQQLQELRSSRVSN